MIFEETFPEVERVTRYMRARVLASVDERHVFGNIGVADPEFLKIFNRRLLVGNDSTALGRADGALITTTFADRLFGGTFSDYSELVGRTMRFHTKAEADFYTVEAEQVLRIP